MRTMEAVASTISVIALTVAATTSCAADPTIDTAPIQAATVRVRADGCGPRTELGTGTAIGDGLVVTAAHVVAGSTHVAAVAEAGRTVRADVVYFDPGADVAVLRSDSEIAPAARLRAQPGREGERGVIALVADDGSIELVELHVLQNATIRTTDLYSESPVQRRGLRVDVAVEPGDSGAMVHLPGGGVGIVWSRSQVAADRTWTVDLPPELLDASSRRDLRTAVDTGPCR